MSCCAQDAGKGVFLRDVMPEGSMNVPIYPWGGAPCVRTEKLGGLEESVGSEDGGDNLSGGIDGAFAV